MVSSSGLSVPIFFIKGFYLKDFLIRRWYIQHYHQIRTFLISLVKSPQLNFYLFIFGVCFLFGLIIGFLVGNPPRARNSSISQVDNSLGSIPAIKQQNILFIGVDHFRSQSPLLESIWLMIYLPSRFHLKLVPIYPTPFKQISNGSLPLTKIMEVNTQDRPTTDFFETLHSGDIWWNHYVLIDETGLIETINFLGGSGREIADLEGDKVIKTLPLPWLDRVSALQGQTSLLQGLCQQINEPSSRSSDINQILRLIPDHIKTDMDISDAVQNWSQLVSRGNQLDCEFPLTDVSVP